MAEAALQRNLEREAFILLINLHKAHGDYDGLESAYLMLANLLKGQGKEGDAKRILAYLKQRKRQNASPSAAVSSQSASSQSTSTHVEAPKPAGKDSDSSSWELLD